MEDKNDEEDLKLFINGECQTDEYAVRYEHTSVSFEFEDRKGQTGTNLCRITPNSRIAIPMIWVVVSELQVRGPATADSRSLLDDSSTDFSFEGAVSRPSGP